MRSTGSRWCLKVAYAVQAPARRRRRMPEYATIVLRNEIEECCSRPGAPYSSARRCRPICRSAAGLPARARRLDGRAAWPTRSSWATGLQACLLTEVEAETRRPARRATLPLGLCRDDQTSGPLAQQLAVTRVRRAAEVGYLTDAFALDAFARNVIDAMRREPCWPSAAAAGVPQNAAAGRARFGRALRDPPAVRRAVEQLADRR